jgi:hypothetical protein
MSAWMTALMESSKHHIASEALCQKERAEAAESHLTHANEVMRKMAGEIAKLRLGQGRYFRRKTSSPNTT